MSGNVWQNIMGAIAQQPGAANPPAAWSPQKVTGDVYQGIPAQSSSVPYGGGGGAAGGAGPTTALDRTSSAPSVGPFAGVTKTVDKNTGGLLGNQITSTVHVRAHFGAEVLEMGMPVFALIKKQGDNSRDMNAPDAMAGPYNIMTLPTVNFFCSGASSVSRDAINKRLIKVQTQQVHQGSSYFGTMVNVQNKSYLQNSGVNLDDGADDPTHAREIIMFLGFFYGANGANNSKLTRIVIESKKDSAITILTNGRMQTVANAYSIMPHPHMNFGAIGKKCQDIDPFEDDQLSVVTQPFQFTPWSSKQLRTPRCESGLEQADICAPLHGPQLQPFSHNSLYGWRKHMYIRRHNPIPQVNIKRQRAKAARAEIKSVGLENDLAYIGVRLDRDPKNPELCMASWTYNIGVFIHFGISYRTTVTSTDNTEELKKYFYDKNAASRLSAKNQHDCLIHI